MHIDAIAFTIAGIREMDIFQYMATHGDNSRISKLPLVGKLEPIFAKKAV